MAGGAAQQAKPRRALRALFEAVLWILGLVVFYVLMQIIGPCYPC